MSVTMNRFHCCASCKHYAIEKLESGVRYRCSRLGYETKPSYQFNCWNPRETVLWLMRKENEKRTE